MLIGPTELLDAERIASLAHARSTLAGVTDALSRVSSGLGIARSHAGASLHLPTVAAVSPLGHAAESLLLPGVRASQRVDHGDAAWNDVSVQAAQAADLLARMTPGGTAGAAMTTAAGAAAGARRLGGLVDVEVAVEQLRRLSSEAASPAARDAEIGGDRLALAQQHVDAALHTSIWNHVSTGRGELRVRFRDGDIDRVVGDGRTTGSAAERTALQAHATMADVQSWFRTRFGHDGHDGRGGDLELALSDGSDGTFAHARLGDQPYGRLEAKAVAGDAGGSLAGVRLAAPATDVGSMTHEYAHLVQGESYDRDLTPSERGVERSLLEKTVHEGVSDIFEALRTGHWSIGSELVLGGVTGGAGVADAADAVVALRNVGGDPALSLRPLATTLAEVKRMLRANPGADPHVLGGVVSRAGREIQERIGWQALGDLTWATVQDGGLRRGSIDPRTWAVATRTTAERLWSGTPAGRARIAQVRAALASTGF